MDASLHHAWESAVGNPFVPTIGKGSQFFVGITLLVTGILLSGLFGLSMCSLPKCNVKSANESADRSLVAVPLIGVPASLAFA